MDQIDYFKGVSNQEFIDYYKVDLYSRMEITLYTYPHEQIEEDPRPIDHLNRCSGILYNYLYSTYENAKYELRRELHNQDLEFEATTQSDPISEENPEEITHSYASEQKLRNEIVNAKMHELTPILNEVIDEYLEKVKLNFIDL